MNRDLALLLIALALTGCGDDRRSVTLKSGSDTLFACKVATIGELTPAGGGYKYACADPGSPAQLYLIFDTTDRKDGTLSRIDLVGGPAPQTLLPAVTAGGPGNECPWAAQLGRKTGEAPVPKGEKGRFTLAMARPCGEVVLEVGEAAP